MNQSVNPVQPEAIWEDDQLLATSLDELLRTARRNAIERPAPR